MTHTPHPYGDCDSCGTPDRLLDTFEHEATRLGINLSTDTHNSWDMTISVGAREVARLILALRQATRPLTRDEADALLLELVDGIDSVGG